MGKICQCCNTIKDKFLTIDKVFGVMVPNVFIDSHPDDVLEICQDCYNDIIEDGLMNLQKPPQEQLT